MNNYKRVEKYIYDVSVWNIIPEVIDNNFEPLVDQIISSNKSINIDGRAGCGKSYLISGIQQRLLSLGKRAILVAPTNKSANLIKGKTIHKFCVASKI